MTGRLRLRRGVRQLPPRGHGDIAEGVLFRSSSPVNPELGRNTYADALVEKAGVKTAINLADSQEELAAYEGYADSYYATLNVVALDMGVDFAAEDFNAKLKTGLEFLIANEGPYVIHCNEGKDRAGFTARAAGGRVRRQRGRDRGGLHALLRELLPRGVPL